MASAVLGRKGNLFYRPCVTTRQLFTSTRPVLEKSAGSSDQRSNNEGDLRKRIRLSLYENNGFIAG